MIHHKSYAKRKNKSVSKMYEICVYDEKKRAIKWGISILDCGLLFVLTLTTTTTKLSTCKGLRSEGYALLEQVIAVGWLVGWWVFFFRRRG